jgi:K+-transporting ATPase ATPase A chain
MTLNGWLQLTLYFGALLLLVKPLGSFMARVYQGERTFLSPVFAPLERLLYRWSGVDPQAEMDWKIYTLSVLLFSVIGYVFLYLFLRLQGFFPLNPVGMGPVAPDLALNIAVSFVTNTNWQNYGGETTLSYLTQMIGLTVQNFVSAAAGMAILIAFIRGLTRHNTRMLGNFWVDLTRGTFYILLPLSLGLAMALVSQGVVQTFASSTQAQSRQSLSVRLPLRSRSNSWVPTAVASLTPTQPTPSKIQPPSPTSSRCFQSY